MFLKHGDLQCRTRISSLASCLYFHYDRAPCFTRGLDEWMSHAVSLPERSNAAAVLLAGAERGNSFGLGLWRAFSTCLFSSETVRRVGDTFETHSTLLFGARVCGCSCTYGCRLCRFSRNASPFAFPSSFRWAPSPFRCVTHRPSSATVRCFIAA